jgi:hypothetical protein
MRKRFIAVLLSAIMLVAMAVSVSFAATEYVKMTTYTVLKIGNTVYCPSAGDGIYKVTVKNGKVRKVKWLKKSEFVMGDYSYNNSLKKKGNYLYYIMWSEGTYCTLHRINLNRVTKGFTGCFTAFTAGGRLCAGCGLHIMGYTAARQQ